MTLAPSRAIMVAVARPMPKAAPAIIATFPASLPISQSSVPCFQSLSVYTTARREMLVRDRQRSVAGDYGPPYTPAKGAGRQYAAVRQQLQVVDHHVGQAAVQGRPMRSQIGRPEYPPIGSRKQPRCGSGEVRPD